MDLRNHLTDADRRQRSPASQASTSRFSAKSVATASPARSGGVVVRDELREARVVGATRVDRVGGQIDEDDDELARLAQPT